MSDTGISRREFLGAASGGLVLVSGTLLARAGGDHPSAQETQPDLRVRRNIASLTPDQVASIRKGVAVMVARPLNDPTSWGFQANVHGMPGLRTNPLWKRCEHGTLLFLAWHRGYLYFFERMLRKAAEDDTFTLPTGTGPPAPPCRLRIATRPTPRSRCSLDQLLRQGSAADHEHASATFDQTLDATATIAHLRELRAWDLMHISVTLRPVTVVAPHDKEIAVRDRAAASAEAVQISYKRVNLRIAP